MTPHINLKDFGLSIIVDIIAFYYPGKESEVDKIFHCEFLGNFYIVKNSITFNDLTYTNSEAIYQAQKFFKSSDIMKQFTNIDGIKAFHLSRYHKNAYIFSNEESWNIMYEILTVKFSDTFLFNQLEKTGNSFLLEHNEKIGRDKIWSNNGDGTGLNLLGMILMIIRDYNRKQHLQIWLPFIKKLININTGSFLNKQSLDIWSQIIIKTTDHINNYLKQSSSSSSNFNKCERYECNYQRKYGYYCSKECSILNTCERNGCEYPKYNKFKYCSKRCATLNS